MKSAHYHRFGCSAQPSVADADGFVHYRDGFESLDSSEWTSAESWIAEREERIAEWRDDTPRHVYGHDADEGF